MAKSKSGSGSIVKSVESMLPKGISLMHVVLAVVLGLMICSFMNNSGVEGLTFSAQKTAKGTPAWPHCKSDIMVGDDSTCVIDKTTIDFSKKVAKNDDLGNRGGAVATGPEQKLITSKLDTLCSQAKGAGCGTDKQTSAIKDDAIYKLLQPKGPATAIKCKAGASTCSKHKDSPSCGTETGCTWETCSFANTKMGASSSKADAEIYYDYDPTRLYEKWIKCGVKGGAAELIDAKKAVTAKMGAAVMKSSYPYDSKIFGGTRTTADDLKHGAWNITKVTKGTGLPSEWEESVNNMKAFCGTNHHDGSTISGGGKVGWDASKRSLQCVNHNESIGQICTQAVKARYTPLCGHGSNPDKTKPSSIGKIINSDCNPIKKAGHVVWATMQQAQEAGKGAAAIVAASAGGLAQ